MNVFELAAKISLDSSALENGLSSVGGKVKSAVSGIAKVGTAAVGAASAGAAALTKMSVDSYAEYEQLVGGVETLFNKTELSLEEYAKSVGKTAQEAFEEWSSLTAGARIVQNNADEAYKNAGLSANEYMETVTSFSASLIAGLSGDTKKAAEYADKAIVDMADNANKMGSSMESIQNAYQGFAKQNYTMLDNLKLGYGGTASEMARLINDSGVMGEKFKATAKNMNEVSFDKIIEAIHVTQERMGIAGATYEEAEGTITGSIASMKSAWENLITGLADSDADLDTLIDNFVSSVSIVAKNITPAITKALNGVNKLINELLPVIVQEIPKIINQNLPGLLTAAVAIVTTIGQGLIDNLDVIIDTAMTLIEMLGQGLIDNLPAMITAAFTIIEKLATSLLENLPMLLETALQIITTLADGLTQNLPTMIPQIVSIITQIVETLTQPDVLGTLIDASIAVIMALADGIIASLPILIESAPVIVGNLVTAIVENVPKLLSAAVEIIGKLVSFIGDNLFKIFDAGADIVNKIKEGIASLFGDLVSAGEDIINKVWDGIKTLASNAVTWGKDLIDNFISGIKSKIGDLKDTVSGIASTVKDFIGFSEPDEGPLSNFHTYAPDMMELFAQGIKENENLITDQFNASLGKINTSAVDMPAPAPSASVSGGGNTININVEGMQISNDYDSYRFAEKVSEVLKNLEISDNIAYGGVM
jgi:phage-related protein